ncbi:MAG: hypothetical protein QXW94_05945, partial [Desulfurococcaceae archaeon]
MGGDREGRSLLLPILIISLAITTILLLAVHLWFRPSLHPWGLRERPLLISLWDIEFFYIAKTVFSTLNALLLLSLLAIYVDMYRKTRSEFTVGL